MSTLALVSSNISIDEKPPVIIQRIDSGSGLEPAILSRPETCQKCHFDVELSQKRLRDPSAHSYATYAEGNAYPPSEIESAYKAEILEASAQMSAIDDKLEHLERAVFVLKQERIRIAGVVGKYRRMLRPIHKLPPELLTRIFLLSVDKSDVHDYASLLVQLPSSLNPSQHPWALSQVCQSWRKLALSSPTLWSFLSFALSYPGAGDPPAEFIYSQCFRMQLQLSRCGEHPVDVVTSNPYPISSTMELFLLPLCFHSPKWRHLRIDLDSQRLLPRMASITGRLQSLASLHIRFIGPVSSDFDCFQLAPQLEMLVLSVDPSIADVELADLSRLRLPYRRITRYHWYDEDCGSASHSQRNHLRSLTPGACTV
ncbi:hypothetical protein PQX77_022414 [Marasmius sp. AFHP31]|nr:hypothetical protein PQX77_022414 [Marasmius sp. AFHP31]